MIDAEVKRKRQAKPFVRPPFTEDEEAFEGQTYYSTADIDTILETFTPRLELDRDDFTRRLEGAAWWYVHSTEGAATDTAAAPSVRQRYWQRLAKSTGPMCEALRGLNPSQRNELEAAARDVARRDGAPDTEPVLVPIPAEGNALAAVTTDWPVARQLNKVIAELYWLTAVLTQAGERAERERTGSGPQPDAPLHRFMCTAISLLRAASAEPVKLPSTNRVTGKRESIMLDFLDAALRPLRFADRRSKKARFEELYGVIDRLRADLRPPRPLGKAALPNRRKRSR